MTGYTITSRSSLGRQKRRYTRGVEYAGIFLLISANAKLFEPSFNAVGIGFFGCFILFGVFFIVLCWAIGFADERWGIWKEENDHGWAVTPKADRLCQRVGKIAKEMHISDKDGFGDIR